MNRSVSLRGPLSEADPVLEQLIEECAGRLEAGELLDVEEYVCRHPEYEERLRKVLPALQRWRNWAARSVRPGKALRPAATRGTRGCAARWATSASCARWGAAGWGWCTRRSRSR
ncbi:MAG: hypothetical protein L0Z62_50375 [Gemmataceae bacterium]|nr:hypothetical protein [Gemmataceae bacterium]